MAIESTRLRTLVSKDLEKLLSNIDQLRFKIEIKSIDFVKNKWHVIYVLPEMDLPALNKIAFVIDLDK